MKAAIAGRAGVAVCVDGERLFSLHLGNLANPVPRTPGDLTLLIPPDTPVRFIEDVPLETVAEELASDAAGYEALHLLLGLLDPEVSASLRTETAIGLDRSLADPQVTRFVQGVVYARPLPQGADVSGALERCTVGKLERPFDLISHLSQQQEQIRKTAVEWDANVGARFASPEERAAALSAAVREGEFFDAVMAAVRAETERQQPGRIVAPQGIEPTPTDDSRTAEQHPGIDQDRAVARRLHRTWDPFFGSFGRLTEIQRAVIPAIVGGQDVLVCSATASGKTEAACAPLVERFIGRQGPWTILYVSPTRALVNDLYMRLQTPLGRLGLRLIRRTGDYPTEVYPPPHVLLTTPESFDSILCRGRVADPEGHAFAWVTAVVLDEIHLLRGSARGEQVRWLLERLHRLRREAKRKDWATDESIQVVGLSATVPNPDRVRDAYLPAGTVLSVPGGRSIETVAVSCDLPQVEAALPTYLESLHRSEKVLVFCNARRRVDDLVAFLRPKLETLGYPVRAHHGSLSRREREETEAAVKQEARIVVVATSTLELGVDIGDIDLVVLDGPAPDIPALLQRIGRGKRRTDSTRVMTCSGSAAEVVVHSAMIEAARAGWLGPAEEGLQHAVARQQLASYIFQAPRRHRHRNRLQELLDACAAPVVARSLLDHLLDIGELEQDADQIRLGEYWRDQTGRGEIHSNIEGSPGETVVDERSGQAIAHNVSFRGGTGLRAGGELLQVRAWRDRKIEVRRVADARLARGEWSYSSRAWVKGAGQPQSVCRYLGIAEDEWPVIVEEGWSYVFHFGGVRRRAVLELAAEGPDLSQVKVNEWFIEIPTLDEDRPLWIAQMSPALLEIGLASNLGRLERLLARPQANKSLPLDVRINEIRSWLQMDKTVAEIQRAHWVRAEDADLREVLSILKDGVRTLGRRSRPEAGDPGEENPGPDSNYHGH